MELERIQRVDSQRLLQEAVDAAHKWESALGEGEEGKAEAAFAALKNGKIELGNPSGFTYRVRKKAFAENGLTLLPGIEAKMTGKDGHAFYLISVPTLLYPARGAEYVWLECQLVFGAGENERQPAIHAVFPQQQWKPVLSWGGSLHLALDSGLRWGVAMEQIEGGLENLGGDLAGRIANLNELAGFITIAPFEYELGRMEIISENSSQTAMWRFDSKEAIRSRDESGLSGGHGGALVVLLQVPKEVEQIQIQAAAQAKPSFPWLIAQVEHLSKRLPEAIQNILRKEEGLPLQDFQEWELTLRK